MKSFIERNYKNEHRIPVICILDEEQGKVVTIAEPAPEHGGEVVNIMGTLKGSTGRLSGVRVDWRGTD